jgi:mannose-6-phosphate isomerase
VISKEDVLEKEKEVMKPWGREVWLTHNEKYVMKFLEVKEGERLSLQYHEEKDEALLLFEGKVLLTLGTKDNPSELNDVVWKKGEVVRFKPGTIHRMKAITNSFIIEVSTPEVEDVVRIEDDYNRVKE